MTARPKTKKEITEFQRKTKALGYYTGKIDGLWGPLSQRAWDTLYPPVQTAPAAPVVTDAPAVSPIPYMGSARRTQVFGKFDFSPYPARTKGGDPITIKGGWDSSNIVLIQIPQLVGVPVEGVKSKGGMRVHKLIADQVLALWAAWEAAGVLPLVLTYEGAYAPRYTRGSTTSLSNHAWGTAFDINYQWNRLGYVPAAVNKYGTVRPLVSIAAEFGFYWGGYGWGTSDRRDGMHFEAAKVLTKDELNKARAKYGLRAV